MLFTWATALGFSWRDFLVLTLDVTNETVALAHSLTWVDSGNSLLLLIEKANTGEFLFMLTNR